MRLLSIALLFVSVAHADCFIDGANTPRCYNKSGHDYIGTSWPVYTADSPQAVIEEMDRKYANDKYNYESPRVARPKLRVMNVNIKPNEYPDVMCLQFEGSKYPICFDTMEITER